MFNFKINPVPLTVNINKNKSFWLINMVPYQFTPEEFEISCCMTYFNKKGIFKRNLFYNVNNIEEINLTIDNNREIFKQMSDPRLNPNFKQFDQWRKKINKIVDFNNTELVFPPYLSGLIAPDKYIIAEKILSVLKVDILHLIR